jgi:hypothetical protein
MDYRDQLRTKNNKEIMGILRNFIIQQIENKD